MNFFPQIAQIKMHADPNAFYLCDLRVLDPRNLRENIFVFLLIQQLFPNPHQEAQALLPTHHTFSIPD